MPSGHDHIRLAFLLACASEDAAGSRCPTENEGVAGGSCD